MRTLLLSVLCLFALVGFAQPASADVACFDFSCDSNGTCSVDASCSSATPYIWKYEFDWGDGTSTGPVGTPQHNHLYVDDRPCDADITLTIYAFNENSPTSVTCNVIHSVCPFGPNPPPHSGRCQ